MKASLQGEGFQVSSSFTAPRTLSEECPVLINRLSPSSSGMQSRTVAVAHVIWGVFWPTFTNNLKGFLLSGTYIAFCYTCTLKFRYFKCIFSVGFWANIFPSCFSHHSSFIYLSSLFPCPSPLLPPQLKYLHCQGGHWPGDHCLSWCWKGMCLVVCR